MCKTVSSTHFWYCTILTFLEQVYARDILFTNQYKLHYSWFRIIHESWRKNMLSILYSLIINCYIFAHTFVFLKKHIFSSNLANFSLLSLSIQIIGWYISILIFMVRKIAIIWKFSFVVALLSRRIGFFFFFFMIYNVKKYLYI